LKATLVAAIALVASVNVYNARQSDMEMSDLALANVEALDDNETMCPDCDECTGEYYICDSDFDDFINDMYSNCGGFSGTIHYIPNC